MRDDGPVVIALDGSPQSLDTLDWGMDEAAWRGAGAVLARVCALPHGVVIPSRESGHGAAAPDVAILAYLERSRAHARHRCPDVECETRLLHGPEAATLRGLAEQAQLVVVGARGTGPRRRTLGPVTAHLTAHARCPVAVVRAPPAPDAGAPVVVGVDGSAASVAAAGVAAHEAALRGVAVVVVHARPTLEAARSDPRAASPLRRPAEAYGTHRSAQRVAARLRRDHPGLDVRLDLRDDDPAPALLESARHAQLLVVGSRGVGALRRMLLGPVSVGVLRESTVTVLVVHATEATLDIPPRELSDAAAGR